MTGMTYHTYASYPDTLKERKMRETKKHRKKQ